MDDRLTEITWEPSYMQAERYCDCNDLQLFHYTSPDGLLGILQPDGTAKLWFTQYDSLNDTKERTDILDFLKVYCELCVLEKRMGQEFADLIRRVSLSDEELISYPGDVATVIDLFGDGVDTYTDFKYLPCYTYLCCFSRDPDLLPMWNYYTKSNRYEGYSVGFLSNLFQQEESFEKGYSIELKRVLYSHREKSYLCDKLLLPLNEIYLDASADEKERIAQIVEDKINSLQFVFKDPCFEHEKEVRAILKIPRNPVTSNNPFDRKYRNSNGYIVPYVEYPIPPNSVSSITVAPLLQPEISKKNVESMLRQYGHSHAYVQTSSVPIRF